MLTLFRYLSHVPSICEKPTNQASLEIDDNDVYESEDSSSEEIADPPEMSFTFDVWDTHMGSLSVGEKARFELHPHCVCTSLPFVVTLQNIDTVVFRHVGSTD